MTIRDLIYDVEVQGDVTINKITDDDVIPVYKGDNGISLNEAPYLDKEIAYLYASQIGLVIEYWEED